MLEVAQSNHQKLHARPIVSFVVVVCALIAANITGLLAEEALDIAILQNLSVEQLMQIEIPTVYGASKYEQKITEAPSSVSIVTRDEIQKLGHRTLADILRSVRDFYVTFDRSFARVGVRGANRPGDYSTRLLFLVDGHRVNEALYDSVGPLNDFIVDVDLIERVEVIRGPGSSLYGNNAFFGVVNVITRKGGNVKGLEASGEAGSFERYKGRLTYGNTFANGMSFLLSASRLNSQGDQRLYYKEFDSAGSNFGIAENLDGEEGENVFGTVSYKDFTLQGGYVRRSKDVPTAPAGTQFNRPHSTMDERSFVRLTYSREFANELTVRANVSWNRSLYSADRPHAFDVPFVFSAPIPPISYINRIEADAEWLMADLQISKRLFKVHRLTLGAEFQNAYRIFVKSMDAVTKIKDQDIAESYSTTGIYIQDEWAITKQLTLNAGARYDYFETFGGTVNPRAAVIYRPWEKTAVKLVYGQAYHAPNVIQSRFSSSPVKPERVKNYEVILEQALLPGLRLSVSGFYNRTTDLIVQDEILLDQVLFRNQDDVETKGASVEIEAKLPKGIDGRISYTFQRPQDRYNRVQLCNSPAHMAKLSLAVPLYWENVFAGFDLQYQSQTHSFRGRTVDGFCVANVTLFSRALIKNLEFSASVYNVFDTRYEYVGGTEYVQDGIEQDGRTFRVKFNYKF